MRQSERQTGIEKNRGILGQKCPVDFFFLRVNLYAKRMAFLSPFVFASLLIKVQNREILKKYRKGQ